MATLKRVLETLDGLEEGITKLYVEKDGKFHLDVEADDTGDKHKNMIPISRLNQEIEKRKASESQLTTIADELKKDVPEEFTDLVPNLPPVELIPWIRNAQAKGLFSEKKIESVDTKRPGDKKGEDLENLSPQGKMARGYNK